MNEVVNRLLHPDRLYARSEVIGRSSEVPAESGIYAWYFQRPPSTEIDLAQCWNWRGRWLLYVGISPTAPSRSGKRSRNNLRKRIRGHMGGNASGSTLRLSIGCLLSDTLGIQLRRVGRTERLTFSRREAELSEWLEENAFVTWVAHDEPWAVEPVALSELYLPLNLDMNTEHPFYGELQEARKSARAKARRLPVLAR